MLVVLTSGLWLAKNQRQAGKTSDTFQVDCSQQNATGQSVCQQQVCINDTCISESDITNVNLISSSNAQLQAQIQNAQLQATQTQAQTKVVQAKMQDAKTQGSQAQAQLNTMQGQVKQLVDKIAVLVAAWTELSKPVNCVLSGWSNWGGCSKTCGGGVKTRTRSIMTPSRNGGVACEPLQEQQSCNTQGCPADCKLSEWSGWSSCNKTCGGGTQTRTRSITTPAQNGGAACSGPTQEQQACNPQPCPVDCKLSDWSNWSGCSKTCGGGTQTRTRSITTPAKNGGAACNGPPQEQQSCNTTACPVPADCKMSDWSAWSGCNKLCDSGIQTRTRSITQQAQNGGTACSGTLQEQQSCNTVTCASLRPAVISPTTGVAIQGVSNGESTYNLSQLFTNPSGAALTYNITSNPYTNATLSGSTLKIMGSFRNTSYKVLVTATNMYGTSSSPAMISVTEVAAPVNCEMSDWSNWGACNKPCGGGVQTRTRVITKQAQNGGAACGATQEQQSCNTQACPVDCEMSGWSAWSGCSKTCGGGVQTRNRSITKPVQNGGSACGPTQEQQSCNTQACPVNCEMSGWSNWSGCSTSCGGGVQSRIRTTTKQAQNGGAACSGSLQEQQSCNPQPCPVDCKLSDWSNWSGCSKTCGGGTQTRTRSITQQAQNGGAACNGPTQEQQSCNTTACPVPADCKLSGWSAWSGCSKLCDSGIQTRTRSITQQAQNGGTACSNGLLQEQQSCNTVTCASLKPAVISPTAGVAIQGVSNGESTYNLSQLFTNPSGAALSFNITSNPFTNATLSGSTLKIMGSFRNTSYKVLVTATNIYGTSSSPATISVTEVAAPVNCEMSGWSNWSGCSTSCGGGVQTRTRVITKQAQNGGAACGGPLQEQQSCNTQQCPVNCEMSGWSGWSGCSKPCGGGVQTRSRSITKQAQNGGAACGSMQEQQSCNTQGCAIGVTAARADWQCGPNVNNARCQSNQCCSTSGWCGGPGSAHCTYAKRSDTLYDGSKLSVTAPRADWQCGPTVNNARCLDNTCCSTSGWCGGPGSAHCTYAKRSDTLYDGLVH